jgi:hypothetical protein
MELDQLQIGSPMSDRIPDDLDESDSEPRRAAGTRHRCIILLAAWRLPVERYHRCNITQAPVAIPLRRPARDAIVVVRRRNRSPGKMFSSMFPNRAVQCHTQAGNRWASPLRGAARLQHPHLRAMGTERCHARSLRGGTLTQAHGYARV